jgi:polysaccharide pyruvyl transferase WcaK-like protein
MQLPAGPDRTAPDDYIKRTAEVVAALAADGWSVELFVGDDEDLPAAEAVTARVAEAGFAVRRNQARTIADMSVAMADVDVVIAARFHNLVAGILAGRPTIAIAYASKSADVVARAGSGPAFPVHGFAVAEVLAALRAASDQADEVRSAIAARLPAIRSDAERVLHSLDRFLRHPARQNTRTRAESATSISHV